MVLSIDPGPIQSAYCLIDDEYKPVQFGMVDNLGLLTVMRKSDADYLAIEMVASYGMAVGREVFETVFWIGRFYEFALTDELMLMREKDVVRIYRKDEKMNLCGQMKAKDSNIRQALIDRFGDVGTKKNPGWFYGFKKDIWAAYAVGVTFLDMLKGIYKP